MRKIPAILGLAALAAIGFGGYAWHLDGRGAMDEGDVDGPLQLAGTPAEQGKYLATAANCVACHTAPGGAEYAGGLPFRLPFGTIYSSNLTPDADTGIGSWSDDEFLRAVRSGGGGGGRHLYPAHPYATYAGMARNDVLAIRAYLASLKPVPNKVPAANLRFPYSQRWLLPLWNAMFLDGRRFRSRPDHDAAWNRGAYLATSLGHCGECHTPRNAAYALQNGRALAGAVTQGWKAYDITAGASGIGGWTRADLDAYLENGHAAGHGAAAGPMKEVVAYSTSQLTADDRAALVSYLLTGATAAATAPAPVATDSAGGTTLSAGRGAKLYAGTCAGCHVLGDRAAGADYSNLAGARTVRDPEGTNVLRILATGSPHGLGARVGMPAFSQGYSDTERAALANYVLGVWGHLPPTLTPNDAMRARLAD